MAFMLRHHRNKFIRTAICRGIGGVNKAGRFYKSVPFVWTAPAHHGDYLQNCSVSTQENRSWNIQHYIYAGNFYPPVVVYVSKYHKRWKKFYGEHRWGAY